MPETIPHDSGRFRDTGLLALFSSLWLIALVLVPQFLLAKQLEALSPTMLNLISIGLELLSALPAILYVAIKRQRLSILLRPAEAGQVVAGGFVGFLIVPVSIALSLVMATFITMTGGNIFQEAAAESPRLTAGQVAAAFLAISVAAPLVEEFEFRGVILRGQAGVLPHTVAVLLTGLLFTMEHGRFAGFPSILMGGLVLTFLAVRSGSIWPSVAAHCAYNTSLLILQVIAAFVSQQVSSWPEPMVLPPPVSMDGLLPTLDLAAATIVWVCIAMPYALSAAVVLWAFARYTNKAGLEEPHVAQSGNGLRAAWPWAAAFAVLLGYLALDVLQLYGIIEIIPK